MLPSQALESSGFNLMPNKNLYFKQWLAPNSNHHGLDEIAPGSSQTFDTGWVVNNVANDYSSYMSATYERPATNFSPDAKPIGLPNNSAGDCFRTSALYGTFEEDFWDVTIVMASVTAEGPGNGKLRYRFHKGADPTGANSSPIGSTFESSVAFFNDFTPTILYKVLNLPKFSLNNEYLFLQVAYEVKVMGSQSSMDAHLRQSIDSRILTSNFLPTLDVNFDGMGDGVNYNPPAQADLGTSLSPITITLPEGNSIPPVTVADGTSAVTPGPLTISQPPFDVEPEFGDGFIVDANVKEQIWLLGEHII
jgi:hypothetical protein